MATPDLQLFGVRKVTRFLLLQLGIREGTWKLCVEIGAKVCDVGSAEYGLMPGLVAMVQRLGVVRCPADHPQAVDADRLTPQRDLGGWDEALRELEEE